MPAGSFRSNIGLPNISQYVLRGCGSSVYSIPIAQPFLSAYLTCAEICLSVSGGRKENCPCVIRFSKFVIMVWFLLVLLNAGRCGRHEVGSVGGLVIKGDILPGFQGLLERRTPLGGSFQNLGTFFHVVAAFVARQNHCFQRNTIVNRTGLYAHRVPNGPTTELQDHIFTEIIEQLV